MREEDYIGGEIVVSIEPVPREFIEIDEQVVEPSLLNSTHRHPDNCNSVLFR
jgi:hypothetical protein